MIQEFQGIYRPFSNFWYKDVYLLDDRFIYPTNEHAYQASKTTDVERRQIILQAATPGEAKRLGKHKDTILREDWNKLRRVVMLHLLRTKFTYSDMQQLLLSTENQKLVEGNSWHDNYWGICSCMACKDDIKHNWLGKLLMFVRMEIQIERGIE